MVAINHARCPLQIIDPAAIWDQRTLALLELSSRAEVRTIDGTLGNRIRVSPSPPIG